MRRRTVIRIIDTNKDYYDFYQNIYRDDTIVFDRRDSYNLSKAEFAGHFYYDEKYSFYDEKRGYTYRKNWYSKNHDVLLQVCNTFWLFDLEVTGTDNCGKCTDYNLMLVRTWKDYGKKSKTIKLSSISFRYYEIKTVEKKINAIKTCDYRTNEVFDSFFITRSDKASGYVHEERHIPILQNIGIASLVDPLDIYLALEEYFSSQKTSSERTESAGLTNDEKVTNHGFDLKNSFRGK